MKVWYVAVGQSRGPKCISLQLSPEYESTRLVAHGKEIRTLTDCSAEDELIARAAEGAGERGKIVGFGRDVLFAKELEGAVRDMLPKVRVGLSGENHGEKG